MEITKQDLINFIEYMNDKEFHKWAMKEWENYKVTSGVKELGDKYPMLAVSICAGCIMQTFVESKCLGTSGGVTDFKVLENGKRNSL